jgi:hypothetical protein
MATQIGAMLVATFMVSVAVVSAASGHPFTLTGHLNIARAGHHATLLVDGRVLVTGGSDAAGNPIAQAEVFAPASGTWALSGANVFARIDHAAVLLSDGRVLVVGGTSTQACGSSASAETYDPITEKWSVTADPPTTGGKGLIAVALRDGRILVSGGADRCGGVVNVAMLFNPSTNTWSPTASMLVPRAFHSAVLLRDGRVLVVGGMTADGSFSAGAETYDATAGTWTAVGNMRTAQGSSCGGYTQTFVSLLQSGAVLTAAGITGSCATAMSPSGTPEVFDPAGGSWSPTGMMNMMKGFATLTALPNGTVLRAGGYAASGAPQSSAELFDPASGGWRLVGALLIGRAAHTATRLHNGTVLIAGGNDAAGRTAAAELYTPEIPYGSRPVCIARLHGIAVAVATNSAGHMFVLYPASSGKKEYPSIGTQTRLFEYLPSDVPQTGCWTEIREIGAGLFKTGHSVRVDAEDNIWVVDEGASAIVKFNAEGKLLMVVGRPPESLDGVPAATPGMLQPYLNHPTDVALDPAGNIFVSDGHSDARVVKYDRRGRFMTAVGSPGNSPGQMRTPHSIAADANGNVYVADGGNARIQVFDNNLNLRAIYDGIGSPWAVCVTPGPHQYLYSSSNPESSDGATGERTGDVYKRIGEVYKMELDGTVVGRFGREDNAFDNFRTVHQMDCRQHGGITAVEGPDWMQTIRLRP